MKTEEIFIERRCYNGTFCHFLYIRSYPEQQVYKKNGKPAIQWGLCILQSICVGGLLSHIPGDELSLRLLFWIIAVVVSYAAGLWKCREHAKQQGAAPGDIAGAMAAQAVFPAGVTLAVMMVAGMFIFGFLWAH